MGTTLTERLRLLLLILLVSVTVPLVTAQEYNDEYYDVEEGVDQEELEVDSALLYNIDKNLDSVLTISEAEMNSPMMSVDKVVDVTPTMFDKLFNWCLDHIFIVSVLVIALIYGLFWVIRKLCSMFI